MDDQKGIETFQAKSAIGKPKWKARVQGGNIN